MDRQRRDAAGEGKGEQGSDGREMICGREEEREKELIMSCAFTETEEEEEEEERQ